MKQFPGLFERAFTDTAGAQAAYRLDRAAAQRFLEGHGIRPAD